MTRHLKELLILLLFGTVASTATWAEIPPILYTDEIHHQYPMWVSADAAVDQNGALYSSLFAKEAVFYLQEDLLKQLPSASGCIEVGEAYIDRVSPTDRSTLTKAVEHSELVLLGRVVTKDFGISYTTPGQLLEIRPRRVLKGNLPTQTYFVFIPVGEFDLGPNRICKRDQRYARPPEVGEEVVLLIPRLAGEANERFLNLREASSLVVIDRAGDVRTPKLRIEGSAFAPMQKRRALIREIRQQLRGAK